MFILHCAAVHLSCLCFICCISGYGKAYELHILGDTKINVKEKGDETEYLYRFDINAYKLYRKVYVSKCRKKFI
jgi:hypothetical protein